MAYPTGSYLDILSGATTQRVPGGNNVFNPNQSNFFVPYGSASQAGPGRGYAGQINSQNYLQTERAANRPPSTTGAPNAMATMGYGSPYLDQGVSNNYGYGNLFQPIAGNNVLGPKTGNMMGGSPAPGMVPNFGNQSWLSPPSSNPSEFSNYITKEGNVTYSPVGEQERLLDMLFTGAVSGQGGGPIGNQLFNFAQGQLPPALAQQIMGQTGEQFGKMGARFGTDLGTAMSRGLAQASESQSLDAIKQILGLGGTTAGFQFARGESGLQRAMQEFLGAQQTDPMMSIIGALLGTSGLGG